jgi:hypothetical protein
VQPFYAKYVQGLVSLKLLVMKSKYVLFIAIFLWITSVINITAQRYVNWAIFDSIKFTEQWSEEFQSVYEIPLFDSTLQSLNGELIAITGYLFPIHLEEGIFILKSTGKPMGCCMSHTDDPHPLIQLRFDEPDLDRMKKYFNREVTIVGNLILNSEDILSLEIIINHSVLAHK